jgi:hypothetical protein
METSGWPSRNRLAGDWNERDRIEDAWRAHEPSSPWHYGDQNSAPCANIASVRRATDWNHSSRVLGPYSVLDSGRPGIEAIGVQGLLQSTSHSRQSRRQNTGRSSWRQCVRDVEVISMEKTLSRIISDAQGGIITNSPCTGQDRRRDRSQETPHWLRNLAQSVWTQRSRRKSCHFRCSDRAQQGRSW